MSCTATPGESTPEPFLKRNPGRASELRREALRLQAVAGPGVVPLLGLTDDGAAVELQLEAARGSVADVLAERGPLDESEARAIGGAAARALGRLHDAGLVHADVKPANLLLTDTGELWLGDFEAAVACAGQPIERGSPGRHAQGATAIVSTDLATLGVSLVEIVCGMIPDPDRHWSTDELVTLGCPPNLAADLTSVLGASDPPAALELAELLDPERVHRLPAPARHTRGVDPTPTVDFDPVVVEPPAPTGRAPEPSHIAAIICVLVVVAIVAVVALF